MNREERISGMKVKNAVKTHALVLALVAAMIFPESLSAQHEFDNESIQ